MTLIAACALAQDTRNGVFRVTSTLIQLDAVVTDGKGKPVVGLKPDDFEVDIDGKTYPVIHSNYVSVTDAREVRTAPGKPARMKDAPAPPAPALKADEVKRTIVLMVDDLGLSWESMVSVRAALKKFVDIQMQPGDLVAVMRTGAGSGAIQQFTNNKTILLDVVDHLRWNPHGTGQLGAFEPMGMESDLATGSGIEPGMIASSGGGPAFGREHGQYGLLSSVSGTFGALQFVVEALESMPGRKSVALFSDGFWLRGDDYEHTLQILLDKLVDTANRSGTVFYTFDARELTPFGIQAQDRVDDGKVVAEMERTRDLTFDASQQGLSYLAEKTGGLAYQNGNGLNYGLMRLLEDQQGYYLLAIKPDSALFSKGDGVPKFNHISVHVKQRGLHVRSRTGFFGKTDQEMKLAVLTPLEQVRVAMLSPFLSSDIRVEVTALYAAVKSDKPVVRNLVYIDPKDLHFEPNQIGQSVANIQLLAVAVGPKGEPLAEIANAYTVQAATDRLPTVLKSGLIYAIDVPVPHGGPYQIRAAVRDVATSAMGSAHQYVDVPNVRRDKLALTSLMLGAAGQQAQTPDAMLLAAARRRFGQGDHISYVTLLEGDSAKRDPTHITAELRVYRNNHAVFSAPVKVTNIKGAGWAISGYVKLPADFDPGEYYLEVIARDTTHPKRLAWQWSDFIVLPSGRTGDDSRGATN